MVKKNFAIIVQARFNSKRFPGKILNKINKKYVLLILIDRIKKTQNINDVIVATSSNKKDDKIVDICKKNKIKYFRGPEKNVLKRYYLTSKKYSVDHVIRITSDCPLIDASLVSKMISIYIKKKVNYLSNINPPTFPDGFDIEIFNSKLLNCSLKKNLSKYEKEHVTPYIKKIEKKKYNLKYKKNLSKIRLTLDYKKDLKLIKKLLKIFNYDFNLSYKTILNFVENNPNFFK